jgi:hypothetical protein
MTDTTNTSAVLSLTDGRDDFERYARQTGKCDFERDEFDNYCNPFTQGAWDYWRASRGSIPATPRVRAAWISVADRLPDDDSVVLVSAWQYGKPEGKRITIIARRSGSVFVNEESGEELCTPTHWRPLPAAPMTSSTSELDTSTPTEEQVSGAEA